MKTFEREVALRRRSRQAILAAALAPFACGAVVGILAGSLFAGIALSYVAFFYVTPIAIALAARKRTRRVFLRAGRSGLLLDGKVAIGSSALRSGVVVPSAEAGAPPHVMLESARGRIEVVVRDETEGRELLSVLGFDPSAARATFRAYSRATSLKAALLMLGGYVAYVVALVLLASVVGAGLAALAGFVPLLPLVALWVTIDMGRWTTFDVGADGVLVRWLGKKSFYAYTDLAEARLDRGTLLLVLRSGAQIKLPMLEEFRNAALERVTQAIAAHTPDATAALEPLLARGGRAGTAWLRDVRRLAQPELTSFRAPAVEPERILRVALDPAADATARAGAAAALAPALDDEGRGKLRVAARACASPKLRVALEAAADGEEEALAVALEEVEEARAGARST